MHSIFVDLQLGLSCAGLCPQQSLRLAYGSRPCLAGQGAVAVAALWCWAEATSGPIAWKGPPLQIVLHVVMPACQCSPLMMFQGTAPLRFLPEYLQSGHLLSAHQQT